MHLLVFLLCVIGSALSQTHDHALPHVTTFRSGPFDYAQASVAALKHAGSTEETRSPSTMASRFLAHWSSGLDATTVGANDHRQFLVHVALPVTTASRAALVAALAPHQLGPYLPHGTFVVVAPQSHRSQLARAPSVVHVSELLPQHKFDPADMQGSARSRRPRVVTDDPEVDAPAAATTSHTHVIVTLQRHASARASTSTSAVAHRLKSAMQVRRGEMMKRLMLRSKCACVSSTSLTISVRVYARLCPPHVLITLLISLSIGLFLLQIAFHTTLAQPLDMEAHVVHDERLRLRFPTQHLATVLEVLAHAPGTMLASYTHAKQTD